jgi:hypothetical protein
MTTITVIGGGFAGLVAAISSAEAGARVVLHEAHRELGRFRFRHRGRLRRRPGPVVGGFVAERMRRVFAMPPPATYVVGGWNGLVARLAAHARALGVDIRTGSRVLALPPAPVIVATSLDAARQLLGEDSLSGVPSGRTVLLDVAVRGSRRDAFVVCDLDEAGWLERFTAPDPTLAPPGESLVQVQLPLRPGEPVASGRRRIERLVDLALPGWQERAAWRRHSVSSGRSGALDLPGRTWRDRPAVDRGDGVFLAGDMVAAPGLLSEVSFASAPLAARQAVARSSDQGRPAALTFVADPVSETEASHSMR